MGSSGNINRNTLSKELLIWWAKNKRIFPWRETRNPYNVLVSEVLLHRTKAKQVVSIYEEFIAKFPTIADLSNANLDEVTRLLLPLGLHWRVKLLHQMAALIVHEYKGKIPSSKRELESLPGIGHYISSAVRCFTFSYPEPLLDANTVRILGRIFGVQVTDGSRRKKSFQELAQSILDRDNPREFNYALIDLGALICKPKKPLCVACPLNQMCQLSSRITKICGTYD